MTGPGEVRPQATVRAGARDDGRADTEGRAEEMSSDGAQRDGAEQRETGGETAEGRTVRVVLVDDHRMFRTGVQAEIGETGRTGVEVVGEAADVDQALTIITATRPEVVLLDVHLPGGGGVEVLRRCAAMMTGAERPVRFLALSVSDAAEDVIGVIRGGARGYVTKTITGTDLVDAIFRVADGDAVFSRGWPVSYWTPSPRRTPRRSTRTSTASPSASGRCCD